MGKKVQINRAPVLTLWATIVAQRLGYNRAEALTLGKAVAGLNAQAKGQRLGIYHPSAETPEKQRKRKESDQYTVLILGRPVSAINTEEGVRATTKGKAIKPDTVETYLERKFGDELADVQKAMQALARAYKPTELAARAYALYEEFRPEIPAGTRGWGAQGMLDLDHIRSLAKGA